MEVRETWLEVLLSALIACESSAVTEQELKLSQRLIAEVKNLVTNE